jgi:DNA-binding transcriptional MocR family regulator
MAAGVSIAPGPMFSAARDFTHHVRLNYGHPLTARVETALATLGQAMMAP